MELTSRPGLLGIDVATWGWRRDMGLASRPGLVVQEVATWKLCRDLAWARAGSVWCRDLGLRSRPGAGCLHCFVYCLGLLFGHCSWTLFTG